MVEIKVDRLKVEIVAKIKVDKLGENHKI